MRLIKSLALSISLLTAASLLPPVHHALCPVAAWATRIVHYGTDGSNGRDGRSGDDGHAGRNQTVTASGAAIALNLSGGEGGRGEDGEDGRRPSCSGQPRNVEYDLQAPDGGDGGDGGRGGQGGRGGNLTAYYQELGDLRQILVNSDGGRPGRGGRGGDGVAGCNCRDRRWEIETCTGTPGQSDYSCSTETYICEDGDYGRDGRDGRDGEVGTLGQLFIINQLEPLLADQPVQHVSLAALSNDSVELSKNLWETRSGALSLLAPGSTIRNDYQEYVGRAEGEFRLNWEAPRPASEFASDLATLSIQANNQIGLSLSDDIWLEQTIAYDDDITTATISGIMRASEVTQLAVGDISGRSNNFALAIVDRAGQAEYLDTEFRLVFRTSNDDPRDRVRPRYTTRYDNVMPAELVNRSFNRYELAVGRLPISGQHLTPGTLAQFELHVTRTFAGRSATQTITWQGQIAR